jgi:uncharacterized membrane protein YqjE
METATANLGQIVANTKVLARRLLTIGENRLELLTVEVQEERVRLLHAILVAFGVVACGLLAAIALTAAAVVLLWEHHPVAVLLTFTGLYAASAICLYRRLSRRLRDWQTLSATLDQLRKDRACLEKAFE